MKSARRRWLLLAIIGVLVACGHASCPEDGCPSGQVCGYNLRGKNTCIHSCEPAFVGRACNNNTNKICYPVSENGACSRDFPEDECTTVCVDPLLVTSSSSLSLIPSLSALEFFKTKYAATIKEFRDSYKDLRDKAEKARSLTQNVRAVTTSGTSQYNSQLVNDLEKWRRKLSFSSMSHPRGFCGIARSFDESFRNIDAVHEYFEVHMNDVFNSLKEAIVTYNQQFQLSTHHDDAVRNLIESALSCAVKDDAWNALHRRLGSLNRVMEGTKNAHDAIVHRLQVVTEDLQNLKHQIEAAFHDGGARPHGGMRNVKRRQQYREHFPLTSEGEEFENILEAEVRIPNLEGAELRTYSFKTCRDETRPYKYTNDVSESGACYNCIDGEVKGTDGRCYSSANYTVREILSPLQCKSGEMPLSLSEVKHYSAALLKPGVTIEARSARYEVQNEYKEFFRKDSFENVTRLKNWGYWARQGSGPLPEPVAQMNEIRSKLSDSMESPIMCMSPCPPGTNTIDHPGRCYYSCDATRKSETDDLTFCEKPPKFKRRTKSMTSCNSDSSDLFGDACCDPGFSYESRICMEDCPCGFEANGVHCSGMCPEHTTEVNGACVKNYVPRLAHTPRECPLGLDAVPGGCAKPCPNGGDGSVCINDPKCNIVVNYDTGNVSGITGACTYDLEESQSATSDPVCPHGYTEEESVCIKNCSQSSNGFVSLCYNTSERLNITVSDLARFADLYPLEQVFRQTEITPLIEKLNSLLNESKRLETQLKLDTLLLPHVDIDVTSRIFDGMGGLKELVPFIVNKSVETIVALESWLGEMDSFSANDLVLDYYQIQSNTECDGLYTRLSSEYPTYKYAGDDDTNTNESRGLRNMEKFKGMLRHVRGEEAKLDRCPPTSVQELFKEAAMRRGIDYIDAYTRPIYDPKSILENLTASKLYTSSDNIQREILSKTFREVGSLITLSHRMCNHRDNNATNNTRRVRFTFNEFPLLKKRESHVNLATTVVCRKGNNVTYQMVLCGFNVDENQLSATYDYSMDTHCEDGADEMSVFLSDFFFKQRGSSSNTNDYCPSNGNRNGMTDKRVMPALEHAYVFNGGFRVDADSDYIARHVSENGNSPGAFAGDSGIVPNPNIPNLFLQWERSHAYHLVQFNVSSARHHVLFRPDETGNKIAALRIEGMVEYVKLGVKRAIELVDIAIQNIENVCTTSPYDAPSSVFHRVSMLLWGYSKDQYGWMSPGKYGWMSPGQKDFYHVMPYINYLRADPMASVPITKVPAYDSDETCAAYFSQIKKRYEDMASILNGSASLGMQIIHSGSHLSHNIRTLDRQNLKDYGPGETLQDNAEKVHMLHLKLVDPFAGDMSLNESEKLLAHDIIHQLAISLGSLDYISFRDTSGKGAILNRVLEYTPKIHQECSREKMPTNTSGTEEKYEESSVWGLERFLNITCQNSAMPGRSGNDTGYGKYCEITTPDETNDSVEKPSECLPVQSRPCPIAPGAENLGVMATETEIEVAKSQTIEYCNALKTRDLETFAACAFTCAHVERDSNKTYIFAFGEILMSMRAEYLAYGRQAYERPPPIPSVDLSSKIHDSQIKDAFQKNAQSYSNWAVLDVSDITLSETATLQLDKFANYFTGREN